MFSKKLSAATSAVFLVSAMSYQTAHAEAGISVTTNGDTPAPVTANVKFKIVVPKVMILSVGDWGATANTVTWNYDFNGALSALSNADATSAQWNAVTAGTIAASNADADDSGVSDGKLAVKVFGNVGDLDLTATAISDFDEIESGYAKPALSEISAIATSGTVPHTNLDGFAGTGTTELGASAGIVFKEDEWTYKYTPAAGNTPAGGTYDAEVQYTLASA
jgi:hypothetical protein